jgi:hypothetical protein
MATEGDVRTCFDYKVGVKSRWLVADAGHLFRVLRGKPAGWTGGFPSRRETLVSFFKFVEPDLHYDELSLADPLPFVAELVDLMVHQVPRSLSPRRGPAIEERVAALDGKPTLQPR